jgi:hypothetical protein
MDGGHDVLPTLFGAIGCAPGRVRVYNILAVGSGSADARKQAETS